MNRLEAAYYPVILLLAAGLAGCAFPSDGPGAAGDTPYQDMGFDGQTWPRMENATLTVLAYESFEYSFGQHAEAFENLTGIKVQLVTEDDAGQVLQRAVAEQGDPSFDVVYGVDNVLLGRAIDGEIFEPYDPLLAEDLLPDVPRAPENVATPVSQGFIALNVDPRANLTVQDLDDVRDHADQLVVADPRLSTPGLGFLLATVATYGEPGGSSVWATAPAGYDYLDYWNELFDNGVLVVADWTVAYEGHFTGGYGQWSEGAQVDRAIVTSYTTSPAYEMYYEYDTLNDVVLAPQSTFHQVQYMGIARGTDQLAAAQAWIEFCLTDQFQGLLASGEAIYPVTQGVSVQDVYQGRDPQPGSFEPADLTFQEIDGNIERWLREWTDAYERARA